ncbi:MAG TPA: glycosyltransferase family 2 protein [Balneolales bacterium]|nr:glycosyltransferase family 2 protein [Balneolales bacterium]
MSNTSVEKPELSIVVPLFNEQESLRELYNTVDKTLNELYSFEIIFVDDGSNDESWEVIKELSAGHSAVRGIRFRRNYGKSAALQKGFEKVRGNYVVTMDADLQDDPAEIPDMINMLTGGYDLVSGWKKKRHDPVSKTIPSKLFNIGTSWVTGIPLHDFNCGLKAYRREVVDNIYLYGEMHRYVPLLANWEGFSRIGEKVVVHHPRKYGRTKFGVSRGMKGFLDLVSLMFINKYVQRPMHFFGSIGTVSLLIGGGITFYLTIMRLFFREYLTNRPLFLFGIMLLLLGVQFFSIGFLGELIIKHKGEEKTINIKDII